jgi:hypothetical protein
MWVFTQHGFISAVDNGHVPGKLAVRARDKKSLEFLADVTGQEIKQSERADYPYRVYVTKEEFSNFMLTQIDEIDYPNFKNRVYKTRGREFEDACASVWGVMLEVTDDEARGRGLYA